MYVVTVTFCLFAEHTEAFLAAIRQNAQQSLSDELGCHRFDVAIGEDGPTTVFLYELYTDRAAFEAHLASDHFKVFDANAAPWVASKEVATFLLEN